MGRVSDLGFKGLGPQLYSYLGWKISGLRVQGSRGSRLSGVLGSGFGSGAMGYHPKP